MIWKTPYQTYIRIGHCNNCGFCCRKNHIDCPHLITTNETTSCSIRDKLSEICEVCSERLYKGKKKMTHKVCIDFPDHPYLGCLKTGKCGYRFVEAT